MPIKRESTFEANIEAHLLDNGWHQVAPSSYDRKLGLFPDEVIDFVQTSQPKAWANLVKRHGGTDEARQKFLSRLAEQITRRGTIDVLRGTIKDTGVDVKLCYFKPASGLNDEQNARYQANRLGVIRQLHHSESNPMDSLDLTLSVNGIPVATAELKNQLSGQTIENAKTQYRTDRNPADLIFAHRTVVHFAVDPHEVAMATRLAGQQTFFLPFNQGSNGAGNSGTAGNPTSDGYQSAYLWEEVWQRDNWLDLLGNFVHASDSRILFPRFHQWHAVRSLLAATYADGAGVDRLVMHSAGSGKSNTIAWSAHQLSRLHGPDDTPIFDKVIVITDRKVLDRQLQDTVAGFDHTPGTIVRVDKHSSQLKEALQGNAARIIITTLQKFPVVARVAQEDAEAGEGKDIVGRRFAVIVDEAHSSTSGDSVTELKKVLGGQEAQLRAAEEAEAASEESSDAEAVLYESAANRGKNKNLSFFAFTATPKPKTLELFGQVGPDGHKHPFHIYSMRQAIAEGFILDVLANYTTYSVYYKLANTGADDPEIDKGKGKALLSRFASLHPYELDAKAEVIVEHFRQKTAHKIGGRAKAMVVTRSRLHAVKTKEAIDRYIQRKGYDKGAKPIQSLVAFSGKVSDPDIPEVEWTEAGINHIPESGLPKAFNTDDYQVLVVAEKYQTGFDEPLLHTMYVDKKLSGVKAVQTLSRLNRTTPGKTDTFVLDFANTAEEIKDAFDPFYEESFAQVTEPNILYNLHSDLWNAGVLSAPEVEASVSALLNGDDSEQGKIYANIDPAVGRWASIDDDDAREQFRGKLNQFCRAYAFLAQIMPFIDADLERLYLYGKMLLPELGGSGDDVTPQLSKSVQLTHLRLAVTSESAITLEATDEPGKAMPGEGQGRQVEPVMDKLSALIEAMNEKFGSQLTDSDKVWFDQQRVEILVDEDFGRVARSNDRSGFRLVLEDRVIDMLLARDDANGELLNRFVSNSALRTMLVDYLVNETYDKLRAKA